MTRPHIPFNFSGITIMNQWEIWLVKQQYARKHSNPPQPNDPSSYDRMYVVIADPCGRANTICVPIQNSDTGVGLSEVILKRGYTTCITKDCKIVCHNIFTLPVAFFEKKMGFVRNAEQEKIQASLIFVLDLI